jgi:hypothetical protein
MLCGCMLFKDLYVYLYSTMSSLAGGSMLSHEFDLVVAQSDGSATPQSGALRPRKWDDNDIGTCRSFKSISRSISSLTT